MRKPARAAIKEGIMAWTSVATWTAGQLVTASQMNVQLRDNMNHLHDVFLGAQDLGANWRVASRSLEVEKSLFLRRSTASSYLAVATFADTLAGSATDHVSIGNAGGADVIFHTNNTERARIYSAGGFQISMGLYVGLTGT